MSATAVLLAARGALCSSAGQRAVRWACPGPGQKCGVICRGGRNLVGSALTAGLLPVLCAVGGRQLVDRTVEAVCAGDEDAVRRIGAKVERMGVRAGSAPQLTGTAAGNLDFTILCRRC